MASSVETVSLPRFVLINVIIYWLAAALIHAPKVVAIVGGDDASVGEFPHMALLGRPCSRDTCGENDSGFDWFCGGSLIATRFVLTAAHCAYASMPNPPTIVRLGEHNLKDSFSPNRQDVGVQRIVHHPGYHYAYNDIALVQLNVAVTFNAYVQPACLWTHDNDPDSPLIATGWGNLGYYSEQATVLQRVQIPIVANWQCNQSTFHNRRLCYGILEMQLCASDPQGGKDTCSGDSGGPLQLPVPEAGREAGLCSSRYYLVGVTSNGMICGTVNQPGIYTRISSLTTVNADTKVIMKYVKVNYILVNYT